MTKTTDPAKLLASLDADSIRRRLDELSAEESALRVLLRAALARGQSGARRRNSPESEVAHAK